MRLITVFMKRLTRKINNWKNTLSLKLFSFFDFFLFPEQVLQNTKIKKTPKINFAKTSSDNERLCEICNVSSESTNAIQDLQKTHSREPKFNNGHFL